MSATVAARRAGRARTPALVTLARAVGTPRRAAGFLVVATVVTFVYTLLLPYDYTQRFGLANWHYLNAGLLAWSVALGVAMGLVVTVQVYAMRRVAAARAAVGGVGGVAFVASLLPSFLCCTPILPSLLALVGLSGFDLYSTTGSLQYFFAVHQAGFLTASLALLALTCWWGLRKAGRAACLTGDGCAPRPGPRRVSDDSCDTPRQDKEGARP